VITSILVEFIRVAFTLFSVLILARILLSWFNPDPSSPIVRFLYSVTEPVLAPVRRILPSAGMLDLSPIVVLVAAMVLEELLVRLVIAVF
jgi:YggT family protein